MPFDLFLEIADRVGVFVFALSGGIAAVRRDMDIFGVVVLAFLPAVGGGTLRDLILDVPVFWLEDNLSLLLAGLGGITAFFLHKTIEDFKPLRWADAAGLAVFAATGAAKAAELGHSFAIVIVMGVMTATVGGIVRDIVAGRENLLMKEEIYATAALLGSTVFAGLYFTGFNDRICLIACIVSAFALRGCAIIFPLSLPKARQ
ncbi:trimeric intracellular cation channel family protein [Parvularcula flava]|nr:trimeric intracellular cation channel family protein [Aquisalinus luteolus]NHK26786.1 trimeric intracellular cation channel family protein [Aquisalinus luteolus]